MTYIIHQAKHVYLSAHSAIGAKTPLVSFSSWVGPKGYLSILLSISLYLYIWWVLWNQPKHSQSLPSFPDTSYKFISTRPRQRIFPFILARIFGNSGHFWWVVWGDSSSKTWGNAPTLNGSSFFDLHLWYPIGSMYGIFTYIYHRNHPNVGKYTIHGSYGYRCIDKQTILLNVWIGIPHPPCQAVQGTGSCISQQRNAHHGKLGDIIQDTPSKKRLRS